jgi:membrane-associated phospholipid phosphatase
MKPTPSLALLVILYGFAAGMALWASGYDITLQSWLYQHYSQAINTPMRWLSFLALGRTLVIGLLVIGVGLPYWQHGPRAAGRILQTAGQQIRGWLRGQWGWLAAWQGQPRLARMCLMALPLLATTGVLQLGLKILIGRPRPKEYFWNGANPFAPQPGGLDASFWSLPSGHSASTFVIFTWLALAFPRWRVPLLTLAVCLSSSRFLAITPHYLGDVIAGAALGAAVALWFWSKVHPAHDRA